MNLRSSVKKMKALLTVPPKKRDGKWGYDVCTTSRWIHVGVWKECPEPEYVVREVLPVMGAAKKKLEALKDSKHCNKADKKDIHRYVRNDAKRIENIEKRYLRGKASAFAPDHKISERPRKTG